MYDKNKHFEGGKLEPYPHEELGVAVSQSRRKYLLDRHHWRELLSSISIARPRPWSFEIFASYRAACSRASSGDRNRQDLEKEGDWVLPQGRCESLRKLQEGRTGLPWCRYQEGQWAIASEMGGSEKARWMELSNLLSCHSSSKIFPGIIALFWVAINLIQFSNLIIADARIYVAKIRKIGSSFDLIGHVLQQTTGETGLDTDYL